MILRKILLNIPKRFHQDNVYLVTQTYAKRYMGWATTNRTSKFENPRIWQMKKFSFTTFNNKLHQFGFYFNFQTSAQNSNFA